jgi:hypothetical protein
MILEIIRQIVFIGGVLWSGYHATNWVVSMPTNELIVSAFAVMMIGYIAVFYLYLLTGKPFARWAEKLMDDYLA